MSVDFSRVECQDECDLKLFGICDDQPPKEGPAYLSKGKFDGADWIAVVVNDEQKNVWFTAVDHCLELPKRADGKEFQKCDAMLRYESTVIFAELKERTSKNWMKDADDQLRSTIGFFEDTEEARNFAIKRAHICNSLRPKAKESFGVRTQKFEDETGYRLDIQQRIIID